MKSNLKTLLLSTMLSALIFTSFVAKAIPAGDDIQIVDSVPSFDDFTPHKSPNKNQFFELAHKFNDTLQMILFSFKGTSAIQPNSNLMEDKKQDDGSIDISRTHIPANCKSSKS